MQKKVWIIGTVEISLMKGGKHERYKAILETPKMQKCFFKIIP